MSEKDRVPLFEIANTKKGFFKKEYFYVAAYEDGLIRRWQDEEIFMPLDRLELVFYDRYSIMKNELQEEKRVVYLWYIDDSGNHMELPLIPDKYPDIANQLEKVYKNEWAHMRTVYPVTVRWFIGCTAILEIVNQNHPFVYGAPYMNERFKNVNTETANKNWENTFKSSLERDWGIVNRPSLLEAFPRLFGGASVLNALDKIKNADREKMIKQEIKVLDDIEALGEKSIWAWDLMRMMMLASTGYVCGYLSYEESLDLSLIAGTKLQEIYDSWDDYMESYLFGHGFWDKMQHPDDKWSETSSRKQKYLLNKNHLVNPWQIPWDLPLKREWTSEIPIPTTKNVDIFCLLLNVMDMTDIMSHFLTIHELKAKVSHEQAPYALEDVKTLKKIMFDYLEKLEALLGEEGKAWDLSRDILLQLNQLNESCNQTLITEKEQGKIVYIVLRGLEISGVKKHKLEDLFKDTVMEELALDIEKSMNEFVRVLKDIGEFISVGFYIDHEKVFTIGKNMNAINEKDYMNGSNWGALLRHYLGKHAPDVLTNMEEHPEAGMYVAIYKNTPENEKRADELAEIIQNLVDNEEELYRMVQDESNDIEWDG